MKLVTPVLIPQSPCSIGFDTPLLLMGSCFADEVGGKLMQAGFDTLCNPFGTLYNPLSVASCLRRALDNSPIADHELVFHDGLWHSWLHHSRFSHSDKEACLQHCNASVEQTHAMIQRAPWLWITFGTAWVFELSPQSGFRVDTPGGVVANCHKLPAATFCRRRLDVHEIVSQWQPLLLELHALGCHVVFTVSPIRHTADGAHGNQLSKSTLLLAVDQLVQTGAAAYFDSYEILMDELRDYRFYARDLCHPSDLAVDIVWERLQQTYMTDAVRQKVALNEKALRQSLHRPLHPKQ